METRNISKLKDQSNSNKRQTSASPSEHNIKAPRMCSVDKSFFVALIRESESLMAQHIKNSINDSEKKHFEYIKELISESEQRIRSLVETEFQSFKAAIGDLNERVKNLEMKCEIVDSMRSDILELKKKLLVNENSVVASSIRITGIPQVQNEDLPTIFHNICQNLNLNTPKAENIYRLQKIYKSNKPYTPNEEAIVVKLQSPYEKNFLLKSLSKFRRNNRGTLTLNHVGMQSDQPIYINENLTPHNHKIFKAALRLKKDKRILSAYTLRGLVYVKKINSNDPMLIDFIEDLDRLFR